MKKYFSTIVFCFIFTNYSFALSLLPQNSYLQYKDNLKEVKNLQEFLNSDPDTQIAVDGAGSPGNENWYFGGLTVDAVKRFQQKNGLTVNGKVDFKTLRKINSIISTSQNTSQSVTYGTNYSNSNLDTQKQQEIKNDLANSTKESTTPTNQYIDTEITNPYLESSINTNPNNLIIPNTKKTLLDSLLDKYAGYFGVQSQPTAPSIIQTQDTYSNSYSAKTPYYNPQTGIYSSNQNYVNQTSQNSQAYQNNPYLNNSNSQFGSSGSGGDAGGGGGFGGFGGGGNSNNNLFGNSSTGSFLNGLTTGLLGPATGGKESSAGQTNGAAGDIGQCRATSFAHATLAEGCVADRNDQQNGQKSASGVILSRVGVPAIPAVALPKRGSFGDAVEVKDMSTGKCKAFPLLDRGPGAGPLSKGVCIDLTGSAVDILKGRTPCEKVGNMGEGKVGINMVQYAIIPGEKIPTGQTKECSHLK
jgi:hypothetical protein